MRRPTGTRSRGPPGCCLPQTSGNTFLGFSAPADTNTQVDANNCTSTGVCSAGLSIEYVGADGKQYSASVRPYVAPTGTPTYSTAVEGSPMTFDANGFAPGDAQGAITYQWRFQPGGCGTPCQSGPHIENGTLVAGGPTPSPAPPPRTRGRSRVRILFAHGD